MTYKLFKYWRQGYKANAIRGLLLALLLPCVNVWAQSVQWATDFKGGLNTYQSPVAIGDNESPFLKNVLLDKTGSITKRPGYTQLNTTAVGSGSTDVQAVYRL